MLVAKSHLMRIPYCHCPIPDVYHGLYILITSKHHHKSKLLVNRTLQKYKAEL